MHVVDIGNLLEYAAWYKQREAIHQDLRALLDKQAKTMEPDKAVFVLLNFAMTSALLLGKTEQQLHEMVSMIFDQHKGKQHA